MTEVEEAAYHLMWVWVQYGSGSVSEVMEDSLGNFLSLRLDHKDMRAGEDAGEWLQKHGYVECDGWSDKVTKKGLDLLNSQE